MKLTSDEKSYLYELLSFAIDTIELTLEQNNITNQEKIEKLIEQGDYGIEETIQKLQVFKKIKNKVFDVNEPGATKKQINALEKTAIKRKNITKNKIINAMNLLNILNEEITVCSVAKEANISFNTAKKYRTIINEREIQRTKINLNNQKVS